MSDLTQARAALAQSDHPCGVLHSAPDLEGEIKEACALAPGHDGAHYGYAPFVDWKVHLRTALAEVDRLTARVADLEHLEASQHKARARDVAGIVGWLRKEAVKKANTSEAAGNTGAGLTASIQYAELWFTADAIERGDWHDGALPVDPREAQLAAARRLIADDYMPWDHAGGPNDCAHGRSVPCRECDRALVLGGGA